MPPFYDFLSLWVNGYHIQLQIFLNSKTGSTLKPKDSVLARSLYL